MMDTLQAVRATLVIGWMFCQRAMVVMRALFRFPTGTRKSRCARMETFIMRICPGGCPPREYMTLFPLTRILETTHGLNKENHPCNDIFSAGAVGGVLFVFYLPGKCTRPTF